jgi:glycosyltransferase involved in cell wall biosynthesis
MTNVVFIHRGHPNMASFRYRAQIPAHELGQMNGYNVQLNEGTADVVVFSKPKGEDIALAKSVKEQGCKVIADICDDHLTHQIIGPILKEMLELADTIVTPTKEMADRLYRVSGKSPVIIPDPYEYPQGPPHAVGDKLLWFGHETNLKDVKPWRSALNGWDLTIVTGPSPRQGALLWSQETMLYCLSQANVVILPTRKGCEFKSANRLLNAVRAGCFVVASPHPAYEEFRSMLWVGQLKTGLQWAKAFPDDLNGLVTQAQAYVREHYSPETIAKQWAQVIG